MAATSIEAGRSKGRKSLKDLTDGEGSASSNEKEFEGDLEALPRKRLKRERVPNEGEYSRDHGFDFIEQFDSSPGEDTEDTDQDYVPNGKVSRMDSNGNQAYLHTVTMQPVGGKESPGKKGNGAVSHIATRGSSRPKRGCGGGRHLSYSPDTDRRLLEWVMERDKHGLSVTREAIQSMALVLIRKECPDFKASSGWVEKFLNRHKLNLPNKATMLENGVAKNGGTLPAPPPLKPENVNGHPESSTATGSHNLDETVTPVDQKVVEGVVENKQVKHEVVDYSNIPINRRGPTRKRIIRDFKQEEEEEDEDCEMDEADTEKVVSENINTERLKAFNMFVRLFVDENLDRLVPISKQPKDKVLAIIHACQRQFPEFRDRARKRIRTYLKSCRRLKKLKEPLRRTADQINAVPSMSSAQMQEVNNILASACANEADIGDTELPTMAAQPVLATAVTTQTRLGRPPLTNGRVTSPVEAGRPSSTSTTTSHQSGTPPPPPLAPMRPSGPSPVPRLSTHSGTVAPESLAVARAKAGAEYKLNTTEVSAIRQLIASYRESAAFLYRSADELEALLIPSSMSQLAPSQKVLH